MCDFSQKVLRLYYNMITNQTKNERVIIVKKRTYNKKNEQVEKKQKFFMIFSQMEDMINHVCFECLVTCCIDTKSKFNQIKIQL